MSANESHNLEITLKYPVNPVYGLYTPNLYYVLPDYVSLLHLGNNPYISCNPNIQAICSNFINCTLPGKKPLFDFTILLHLIYSDYLRIMGFQIRTCVFGCKIEVSKFLGFFLHHFISHLFLGVHNL